MDKEKSQSEDGEIKNWYEKGFLLARGEKVLTNLDISLNELRAQNSVVDLGAGIGAVETYALSKGLENVTSIDENDEGFKNNPLLKRARIMPATNLELSDNSVDLLIARGSVPVFAKDEKQLQQILQEIERVLSPEGYAKMGPAHLEFVVKSMANNNASIRAFILEARRKESPNIQQYIKFLYQVSDACTTYIQSLGFNITSHMNNSDNMSLNNYWLLKKRDSQKEIRDAVS